MNNFIKSRTSLCRILLAVLFGFSFTTLKAQVMARRANDFVESIGVKAHLAITAGRDGQYAADPLRSLQLMKDLGIRYYAGYYRNSFRDYGLKGIAYVALDENAKAKLDLYNGYESELIGVEGPNEPDVCNATIKTQVLNKQKEIFDEVRRRPALANLPILGPSLKGDVEYDCLGNIADRSTVGNIHPYPGGDTPESYYYEDRNQGRFIRRWITQAGKSHPGQPVWATETAYHTATNWNPADGNRPASERAQQRYVPRLFAYFFNQGVSRSMAYQLLDNESNPAKDNKEAHFGLIRNDWSKKPAYDALQRTIALVNDRDATFIPGTLNYSLSGNQEDIHQTLLQKGNGTFYLLIWQGVKSWDRYTRQDITNVPTRPLIITFNPSQPIEVARIFEPTLTSVEKSAHANPTSLNINVPDHVMVIEIKPRVTSTTPVTGFRGYYRLIPRHADSRSLDVFEGRITAGANVQLYQSNPTNAQQWRMDDLGGGYYRITNRGSNKVLAVDINMATNGNKCDKCNGANVFQWDYTGDLNNKQWKIENAGDGYFRILARHSGKALDVAGGNTENYANVQQWDYSNNFQQQWRFEFVSPATARIAAKEEVSEPALSVYPNPARESVTVESAEELTSVRLLNTMGRTSYTKGELNSKQVSIPVSQLADGVYIIKAFTVGGKPLTQKVVISK